MDAAPINCTKCHQVIKAAAFFRCNGFCGGSFHLNCTSSSQHHLRTVQEAPNLFWCCDICAAIMGTNEFRSAFLTLSDALRTLTEAHKTVVEDVKVELVESNKKLDTLVSKSFDIHDTPSWPKGKRRRSSSSGTAEQPVIPKSSVGRKVMESTVPVISESLDKDDLTWIWLSSFPPTVTKDNIRSMVRECLECDADDVIDVKMLVKKDADIKLRAVSFKVGFDPKYKDVSMDGDNWPAGVAFREFIFYDRKSRNEDSSSGFSNNHRVQ